MRERLVRTTAFLRGELVASMRQPWLLLALVLGPFLILLGFGLGYEHAIPRLDAIVVSGDDDLSDRVDEYLREEEPAGITYRGATQDAGAALEALHAGDVDLVIVLPEEVPGEVREGRQAVIEIHQRSLDPITVNQIGISAGSAVSQVNDAILEEILTEAQGELPDSDADLRRMTEQLDRIARATGVPAIEDAASTLAQLEGVVEQLRDLDPALAVRPMTAEVVSQTPAPITLNRFYALGLVALMLQHLGVTFAALSLVRERETGTAEMLQVTPAVAGERLAGKTLAFVLLAGVAITALIALTVLVFGVPLPADRIAFVGLALLALLASLGLGFLVAILSASHSQAVQLSMLLLLAAIFFSGLFMPLERIELPAQAVSWVLPATYAFTGMQDLSLLAQIPHWTRFVGPALIAGITFTVALLLLGRAGPRRTREA